MSSYSFDQQDVRLDGFPFHVILYVKTNADLAHMVCWCNTNAGDYNCDYMVTRELAGAEFPDLKLVHYWWFKDIETATQFKLTWA